MSTVMVAPAAKAVPSQTLIAPANIIYRRNSSGSINPGASTQISLDTGNKVRFLAIRLQYTLTQPGTPVAITQANILPGDEFGLIESLVLKTTDNDYIIDATALELLKVYARLNRRHKPILTALRTAGTGSPVIDSTLVIPFWMLQSVNHVETVLNLTKVLQGQINLQINWGTVASVTSIAGMTLTGAMTVEIRTLETYGGSVPTMDCRIAKIPLLNVSAGAQKQVTDIPVASNLEYWGFLTHEYITSTEADTPGILAGFRAKNGTNYFLDGAVNSHRQVLFQVNPEFTGYDGDAYATGEILDYSAATKADAWTFWPLAWDGYKTETLATKGLSGLKFEYDIAATAPAGSAVDVYAYQIFKP